MTVFGLNLERVNSSDGTCPQEEVCATKTSCLYWLDRESKHKAGEDPSYLTDARAKICNKQLSGLCCPVMELPTFIPQAGQCGLPASSAEFQRSRTGRIFGGDNTEPGEFPFSALLGFVALK